MRHGLMALTAIAVALAPSAGNVGGLLAARAQQAAPPVVSPTAVPADTTFTRAELETLLKPIALFPDACSPRFCRRRPIRSTSSRLSRWLDRTRTRSPRSDFTAADAHAWDPSVKAMVRFPDLIRKMNADLDWTSDLGDAFVHQPEDVATVIQIFAPGGKNRRARDRPRSRRWSSDRGRAGGHHHRADSEPEVIYVPQLRPGHRL